MSTGRTEKETLTFLIIGLLLTGAVLYYYFNNAEKPNFPESKEEFEIQGLTWSTFSYYYEPGCYDWVYNDEHGLSVVKKAKNAGADYLLLRAFYNGTSDGGLVGDDEEVKRYLTDAVELAHDYNLSILIVPYVESRDYHSDPIWRLDREIWAEKVLMLAQFAEENNVEMFSPGVEMNLILKNESGAYMKEILPEIRKVYSGKVITAEQYDIENWKRIDDAGAFAGYDCIGLTLFPRKEYDRVSDIRSFEDYSSYVEEEAKTIDMLSQKYDISCKLAVPMGLDFWNGSYPENPVPDAAVVAQATYKGLDILAEHDFTGVFISHWASEHDHFGDRDDVEIMLSERWTESQQPNTVQ